MWSHQETVKLDLNARPVTLEESSIQFIKQNGSDIDGGVLEVQTGIRRVQWGLGECHSPGISTV